MRFRSFSGSWGWGLPVWPQCQCYTCWYSDNTCDFTKSHFTTFSCNHVGSYSFSNSSSGFSMNVAFWDRTCCLKTRMLYSSQQNLSDHIEWFCLIFVCITLGMVSLKHFQMFWGPGSLNHVSMCMDWKLGSTRKHFRNSNLDAWQMVNGLSDAQEKH